MGRAGQIGRTALAAQLGMDRTTLTRTLVPLEKQGLIATAESADLREHLLRISTRDRRKLRQSFSLWEKAQKNFALHIGRRTLEELRAILQAAENAAGAASRR